MCHLCATISRSFDAVMKTAEKKSPNSPNPGVGPERRKKNWAVSKLHKLYSKTLNSEALI